jgi:hypothetical protein
MGKGTQGESRHVEGILLELSIEKYNAMNLAGAFIFLI